MTFQLQTDKDPLQFRILSGASDDVTSGLFIRRGYALPFLFYLSECEQDPDALRKALDTLFCQT